MTCCSRPTAATTSPSSKRGADRKALNAHAMAAHTRAFREKLSPMAGALYDERFYKALN